MTRLELMKELNRLLGTEYNWSRINLLDLERLVESVKKMENKIDLLRDEVGGLRGD